jgi:hypothetical protein
MLGVVIPATGWAYARIEASPIPSSTPGLPDGRVYEQVSPADKNGNQAGATTDPFRTGVKNHLGYVSPGGNAVLFEGTGPMGESPWADSLWFVAIKNSGTSGWSTRAALPRPEKSVGILAGGKGDLEYLDPSADLSHAMAVWTGRSGPLAPLPAGSCGPDMYLVGPDPFVAATWLDRPSSELANQVENCAAPGFENVPVGGSPDFSTAYFTYPGTLLPEDASRTTHSGMYQPVESWGFYEYREGVLHEAGVLPDGSLDPYGAVPAASGHGRNRSLTNQVSEDGTRAFFVSPDPASCTENDGQNNCATDPPELYVREDGVRTQLVSRDTLLPESGGLPAAAPHGPLGTANNSEQYEGVATGESYVFASPDGSHAFFRSRDALTRPAQEASPGTEPKTYEFDLDTGILTYLPGVEGEILAVDRDGSAMAFVRPEAGGSPAQIALWTAAPAGGMVTPVIQLPEPGGRIPEARMSSEGSVLVFQTAERLSSSFNSGGAEEVYRYDAPGNTIGCVSCPPAGMTPRGNASISTLPTSESRGQVPYEGDPRLAVDAAGISANGDRIFFESPDPLLPQVSNTNSPEVQVEEAGTEAQGRNVFEWENGVLYLISTGDSPRNSYLLGSSEDGNDVFFATAQGLVPADTDGGYDIYDARVPRPGDSPAPPATPCGASSCQGPANTLSSPVASGSAVFSGAGNLTPEATPSPTPSSAPKTIKCKKGYVKSKNKCVKPKPKKKANKASRASTDRRPPR